MFRFGDPGGRIYTSVGTSNANILAHWSNYVTTGAGLTVSAGNGRATGSCLRFANGSTYFGGNYLTKTLDSQGTWGVAFAFRPAGNPTAGNPVGIVGLFDNGTCQVDLRLYSDLTVGFTRNGTAIGSQSTAPLALNAWNHVEIKVVIHPSAGSVECRINGVARIGPTSSLNTRATANSTANQFAMGNNASPSPAAGAYDFDDVIVWDGQTTDANGFSDVHDFVGDCGLTWALPTGAGTTTQFTPSTGSNYAQVNQATPDGDTTYVEDSTVGHIDTYAMADLAAGASSVLSVAAVTFARKTDAGSRGMATELRSNGGNAAHATTLALGDTYQYLWQTWGQDPNNGSPANWTVSAVNALEAGQKVIS